MISPMSASAPRDIIRAEHEAEPPPRPPAATSAAGTINQPRHHPGAVRLLLRLATSLWHRVAQIHRDLRERSVDLILSRMAQSSEEDLDNEILFYDRTLVVAGLNDPWPRRKIKLSELIDQPWSLPPPNTVKELLIEKGVITGEDIRKTLEFMDARTPALGAKVVARAGAIRSSRSACWPTARPRSARWASRWETPS